MLIRILVVVVVAVWSFFLISTAFALATSPVTQIVALIAAVAPLLVLWRTGYLTPSPPGPPKHPTPSPRDKERELLTVLEEKGAITPVTVAMRTSLTVDEATAMLDELARRGHLEMSVEDGVLVYGLHHYVRRDDGVSGPVERPSDSPASTSPAGVTPSPVEPLVEPLSDRELEVLARLATGRSNKEIAQELFVSVGTIKTHTNNIYRKLGVRNRTEALVRARSLQLV